MRNYDTITKRLISPEIIEIISRDCRLNFSSAIFEDLHVIKENINNNFKN